MSFDPLKPNAVSPVRTVHPNPGEPSIDYRVIVELIDVGITKTDTGSGRIFYANEAFCRMVGYSAQELSAGTISFVEMTHPDDLERNVALHRKFLSGELDRYSIEKRYIRKDGSLFWARATAKHLPQSDNGRKTALGLIEDISHQIGQFFKPNSTRGIAPSYLGKSLARLHPAEDYIRRNWNKPQSSDALAALCKMSTRAFFREFGKVHGISPQAYVKRLRLQRVQEVLLQGEKDASVAGASLLAGFSNQGHFAREYRVAFGELPSETLKRGKRQQPRTPAT